MRRSLAGIAFAMVVCCSAHVQAQYPVVHPHNLGLTPQLQYIHSYDAENETLQLDDIREVTETVVKAETDPATGITRLIPAEEKCQVIERRSHRWIDLRATSPKGEALKLGEILPKLKPDHPVIVIAKGHLKLPAGYQKLLRDDVIVLETPVPDPAVGRLAAPRGALPRAVPPGGFSAPPSLPFSPVPAPASDERF